MKRFKVDGLWSTTREGKNMVPGFLRNGRSGLSLHLLGSFKEGWTPNALGRYEKLYGVIGQGLEGMYATLFDCLTESTTVNTSSVRSEKLRCSRAVIGDDLAPEEPLKFDSLEYDFTYLDNWVGKSHVITELPLGEKKEASIRYNQPEPIEFPVDDFKIQIGFTANFVRSLSEATIREKSQITIEPIGEGFAEEASIRHLSPLQNLLTFATGAPNEVDRALLQGGRISYGNFDVPKRFSLYYTPVFRLRGPKEKLHPVDMLFNLEDVLHVGLNIFQKWYDFVRSHGSFVDIYFAHIYSPAKFISDRFRNVMMAFRLLCTPSLEVPERTKSFLRAIDEAAAAHFDGPERAWLGQALPIGDEVEMPFRLMRSLQKNGDVMSLLIDDFHEFVTVICRTLEYVERRTPEPSGLLFQGGDLYHAIEKVRWLIKLMALRELGFDDEALKRLALRNKNFTFLRSS
jgi:hypothetical protein